VDVGASLGVFLLALAAISFTARVLTGQDIAWNRGDTWRPIHGHDHQASRTTSPLARA
jgi:hypothetical protein